MTNFRIILAYNGTAYHGWQRQNNALAIQQVLESISDSIPQADLNFQLFSYAIYKIAV